MYNYDAIDFDMQLLHRATDDGMPEPDTNEPEERIDSHEPS